MPNHQQNYDILIVGSGFAGSITALCLNSAGYSVCLVEKDVHPRFAIGESSTPIADMILRDLSERFDLPALKKLSRYGSWQTHYPEVTCGIKRGFSYYKHSKEKYFTSDQHHRSELLVAASVDNQNSDTQWYRPETDHLFVKMVMDAGIDYFDQTEIHTVHKTDSGNWTVQAEQKGEWLQFETGFIIDATGSHRFSNQFFGTTSSHSEFQTNTQAIYSHFENVPMWNSYLVQQGFKTDDYPYNPDHSALHHILDEGWLWMLRFNDDRLSSGLVLDQHLNFNQLLPVPAEEAWKQIIKKYPTLQQFFNYSKLCQVPGTMIRTSRLQRRLDRMFGDGWAALHHTAGFVDPLHSTGIAHSLSGVEKVMQIFTAEKDHQTDSLKKWSRYESEFFSELELIDLLVAGCYKSRHHFDLFTAWTMLYFTCTIQFEQQRLSGERTRQFLSADHPHLPSIVRRTYRDLIKITGTESTRTERKEFIDQVRKSISPYNIASLMEPEKRNMYHHSAVKL